MRVREREREREGEGEGEGEGERERARERQTETDRERVRSDAPLNAKPTLSRTRCCMYCMSSRKKMAAFDCSLDILARSWFQTGV